MEAKRKIGCKHERVENCFRELLENIAGRKEENDGDYTTKEK